MVLCAAPTLLSVSTELLAGAACTALKASIAAAAAPASDRTSLFVILFPSSLEMDFYEVQAQTRDDLRLSGTSALSAVAPPAAVPAMVMTPAAAMATPARLLDGALGSAECLQRVE
jgi:hypothetical protein